MTKYETFDLPKDAPVMLKDGSVGLFLIYPIGKGDLEGMCGIQVPGEEAHRWIHHDRLQRVGDAVAEKD